MEKEFSFVVTTQVSCCRERKNTEEEKNECHKVNDWCNDDYEIAAAVVEVEAIIKK